jgi:heme exporter protein D
MMPDLGAYALWVLAAYGVSLALLAAITLASIWQARRTRAALQALEADRASRRAAQDGAAATAGAPAGEGAHG